MSNYNLPDDVSPDVLDLIAEVMLNMGTIHHAASHNPVHLALKREELCEMLHTSIQALMQLHPNLRQLMLDKAELMDKEIAKHRSEAELSNMPTANKLGC